jgi:hypothetical protein
MGTSPELVMMGFYMILLFLRNEKSADFRHFLTNESLLRVEIDAYIT